MHEMLILVKVIKVIQIQQTIFENSKKNEEHGQSHLNRIFYPLKSKFYLKNTLVN